MLEEQKKTVFSLNPKRSKKNTLMDILKEIGSVRQAS